MWKTVSSAWQFTYISVVGGQKISRQTRCDGLKASTTVPGLISDRLFLAAMMKKCSERMIHEYQGSHCKSDKSADKCITVSRVNSKNFMNVGNSVSLSKWTAL
jgi:hypothetical protein